MPFVKAGGLRHYYRLEGIDSAPVIIFSQSLGCDHTQWDAQAEHLLPHFRVLRYDLRGHGASEVVPGDYSIEMLARDVLAIADALEIRQFAFCGLSIGGMIGQWLGANAAERLTHLVLANTSSRLPDNSMLEGRRKTVLAQGMDAIEATVMQRFFTSESLAADLPQVARTRRVLRATDPVGYAGCAAAVRDMNQTAILASIRTPTLIVDGSRDISLPWAGNGDVLAREMPKALVERLPAAHLSNLERPRSFTAALLRFLMPAPENTLEAGWKKRRAALGSGYVDRAVANATDFTRGFQEFITRYAWGSVWSRPGLDDRTRRLLTLTAVAALGRWEEFRIHVRAALDGGMEACDLEEAFLQLAIYGGVPAALSAFRAANEEMGKS